MGFAVLGSKITSSAESLGGGIVGEPLFLDLRAWALKPWVWLRKPKSRAGCPQPALNMTLPATPEESPRGLVFSRKGESDEHQGLLNEHLELAPPSYLFSVSLPEVTLPTYTS